MAVRPPRACWALAVMLLAAPVVAQPRDAAPAARKQARAIRLTGDIVRLDGRLDEDAWRAAEAVTDFVQKEPTEGAPPTDAMEVRFLYDDVALYVGARMYSRAARGVQAPLGRRDAAEQAEHVLVSLDTFLDRRTAAVFGVTAAGVRIDRFHASDTESSFDAGFDPVWDAEVAMLEDGWSAELWIPFSQLRFTPRPEQVWGLNLQRYRPTINEEDSWVLVPRTERAWASRFGELHGIADVRPSRRIEVLPYVASSSTVTANRDRRNPFDSGLNLAGRAGADLKMGLGPNLTLEATINPDFGQVEADPAEVNLTAFETRFPEKRPFFLEGASLFNIGHPNFYYSRRIGARPRGPASADFVDYPAASAILAAGKLTGRLPSKTSLAVLAAVTGEEEAELATIGVPGTQAVPVAPRAYHAVGRVMQEFGAHASTAGFIVNAMHRDVPAGDPLADLLTRNALAAAASTNLRFKGGEYELRLSGGGSLVTGEATAIERVQRSSAHYAQRPDRTYSPLDPALTSLGGWTVQAAVDRTSGRHWLWGANTKIDSENFETNDVALLNGADGLLVSGNVRYRETRPGRVFRSYSVGVDVSNDSTLRWLRQSGSVRASASMTWANFWTTNVFLRRDLPLRSVSLTRGGPLMDRAAGWTASVSAANRSTATSRISGNVQYATTEEGGRTARASATVSFRPGPQWQLSANPFWERLTETQQYVATLAGGRPETYGGRYIFAFIDRSTVSTEFRLAFTLKPDMNLDVYMEPFAASGRYYDYGELARASTRDRITYGAPGTSLTVDADGTRHVTIDDASFALRSRDFNTLSFRSNVVLRWEWRAGSTLYLVWQQDRSGTEALGTRVGFGDAFRSITIPGTNVFVVKTSWWVGG
ncbi:MAG: DUF5916 domain-containing protein [Acidobacteriota bacterium]